MRQLVRLPLIQKLQVTKGGQTDWAVTGSVPSPTAKGPTATGVVSDTGAVVKGSGEEGATAN